MEWFSQNWVWVLFIVAFVAMHLFGHGGHGGHGGRGGRGGGGGCGGHGGHESARDEKRGEKTAAGNRAKTGARHQH